MLLSLRKRNASFAFGLCSYILTQLTSPGKSYLTRREEEEGSSTHRSECHGVMHSRRLQKPLAREGVNPYKPNGVRACSPALPPGSSCVRLSPAVMLGADRGTGASAATLPRGPAVVPVLPVGARSRWGVGTARPPGKACWVTSSQGSASSTVPSPGLVPSHSFPCRLRPTLSTLLLSPSCSSLIVSASPLAVTSQERCISFISKVFEGALEEGETQCLLHELLVPSSTGSTEAKRRPPLTQALPPLLGPTSPTRDHPGGRDRAPSSPWCSPSAGSEQVPRGKQMHRPCWCWRRRRSAAKSL